MATMSQSDRIGIWLDRLNRFAQSNLTTAEFCQLEEISLPSFFQWKRRLSPRVETPTESSTRRGTQTSTSTHNSNHLRASSTSTRNANHPQASFTELVISSSAQNSACVSLPGGITLTLGSQPEIASLIIDRILQHTANLAEGTVRPC